MKGIACVLNSFGHMNIPFQKRRPTCLITKYLNECIGFLVGFGRATNTPPCFKIYVMEPNVFFGYLEKGIVCSFSLSGHEQYLSDSLNENNSAHGVYNVAPMRVLHSF